MLQEFAEDLWDLRREKVSMVVVSIGGNDFKFGDVVETCAKNYLIWGFLSKCRDIPSVKLQFELPRIVEVEQNVKIAIENVGRALLNVRNVNYNRADFTILLQDYESGIPPTQKYTFPLTGLEMVTLRKITGRCPFTDADAIWANNTALSIIDNTVLSAATAAARNYPVWRMRLAPAFSGQRLCEQDLSHLLPGESWRDQPPRTMEWINQVRLMPGWGPLTLQEDFHPNFFGQLALRNCLRQAYNNGRPRDVVPADPICVPIPGGILHLRGLPEEQRGVFTTRGLVRGEPEMGLAP